MKINEIIIEATQYNPIDLWSPEDDQVTPAKDYTHLAQIIEDNCGQMLAVYRKTNRVLWRGIDSGSTAIVANIRPDRVPVEMPLKAHLNLEKAFALLGLKANRSNSIFCTADSDVASDWGKQFVIFVKDGWVGTFFQGVIDEYFWDRIYPYATAPRYTNNIPGLAEKVKQENPVVLTPANLDGVLYEGYEGYKDIIITGTSYIGLRYGTEPYLEVIRLLNLHPKN